MKKMDEETKKKRLQMLCMILIVVLLLAISIACSKVNFVSMGHEFFMKFFSFLDVPEEEPEKEEELLYTTGPEGSAAPAENSARPEETAALDGAEEETKDTGAKPGDQRTDTPAENRESGE